ncbi:MAG: membrane protein insertase YidC, partial [Kiloniellales bacterium]
LTKPFFHALHYFAGLLGNFGLSILLLTVLVKLAFFPLANKSYRAMAQMRKLQPQMLEMRERFGDDKQRLNQEMMALYKREGVNPMSGCLPVVIQIPVFFALYKVLFVSIEMRQAPFYGWIEDLSARDPTSVMNGFGLLPWDVPELGALSILNLGVWPIVMGLSMMLQHRLNPQPTDPMQAKIFMFMPIFFTFLLAQFPAGLVIYWTWNNFLSIIQQMVIMKRAGVPIGRQPKSS